MARWASLRAKLESLRERVVAAEDQAKQHLSGDRGEALPSLRNLVHYLALRAEDIRDLQLELGNLGLSSLGRAEGHVLASIEAVLARVREAESRKNGASKDLAGGSAISGADARRALHAATRAVFGPKPSQRHVYIMVTAPDPLVADAAWFHKQLAAGMNVLRINTAHGTPASWVAIIETGRAAAEAAGQSLRVLVDLPGPKLRTAALSAGPRVLKLKPRRDALGRVVEAGRVRLRAAGSQNLPAPDHLPILPLPPGIEFLLRPGATLKLVDTRGRRRRIEVVQDEHGHLWGEVQRTVYIGSDSVLVLHTEVTARPVRFCCPEIPPAPFALSIAAGDLVALCQGGLTTCQDASVVGAIGCAAPGAVAALQLGHRVLIDDGRIAARVTRITHEAAILTIERTAKPRMRLSGDRGMNFPDTTLDLPCLSSRDLPALAFIEEHADIVGLSFVRSVADVRELEKRLSRRDLALLLKIETQAGFAALPALLLDSLGRRPLAVMIARGDLAVECGFERLAELQEEILWLCEASHVPVVWATQVLETLAKTGLATRAEVTDAAMAVRAECVMLNKGPFIATATESLDSILRRMEAHVYKKRQLLRPLAVSQRETASWRPTTLETSSDEDKSGPWH